MVVMTVKKIRFVSIRLVVSGVTPVITVSKVVISHDHINTNMLKELLLILGVNYLEFLNIFDDDGVSLNRIERTPHYGTVRPIYIDSGIPIGTKIETMAYVSQLRQDCHHHLNKK